MADFFIDHDVALYVAPGLHAHGHQAFTARDVGDPTAADPEHLLIAAANRWILVSHNAADWSLLHLAWSRWAHEWGTPKVHAGILIIPHGAPRDSARLVHQFVSGETTLENRMYEYRPSEGWVPWP